MLIDDEKQFVDLFMDNVIWGNVTINLDNWTTKTTPKIKIAEVIGDWIFTRRDKTELPSKSITTLYSFFATGRFTNVIHGELRDRDHEQKVETLTKDNEKLVNIVSEQKGKIDEYIGNAVDTKNIRGIQ
ncbi:MAG: hypothetical protein COA77_02750 [Thaumarchaeota archaeon]|nr:MAG: hypothetical protein COA77_02750 [Nitrososphaerota archaeon]